MNKISISQARQNLPKIAEEVFFKDKIIILTKRGIPMVKIIKADDSRVQMKIKKNDFSKAVAAIKKIKAIWNDRNWENISSSEMAEILRKRSQETYVRGY